MDSIAATAGSIANVVPLSASLSAASASTSLPAAGDIAAISAQAQHRAEAAPIASDPIAAGGEAGANELDSLREKVVFDPNFLSSTSSLGSRVSVKRLPSSVGDSEAITQSLLDSLDELESSYQAKLERADGTSLDLSFADNVFIQEQADGLTSVYYRESDSTRIYALDGSFTEVSGNALDRDADSIIMNVKAGELTTGNGDNLVFNYANDSRISTGSGNDKVLLAEGAMNVHVSTGTGNDILTGYSIKDSSIDLGDGDNLLNLFEAKDSRISLGQGTSLISSSGRSLAEGRLEQGELGRMAQQATDRGSLHLALDNSTLTLGKGLHYVSLSDVVNGSSINITGIDAADTKNDSMHLDCQYLADSSISGQGSSYSIDVREMVNGNINTGNGRWVNLRAEKVGGDSSINMRGRFGSIDIGTFTDNSKISTARGDYSLSIDEVSGNASISMGGGYSYINVGALSGDINFKVGGGYSVEARFGEISGNALLSLGDTFSSNVSIDKMLGNALVKMGHGDKKVQVGEMGGNASLDLGSGYTEANIDSTRDNALVSGGEGRGWVHIADPQSA